MKVVVGEGVVPGKLIVTGPRIFPNFLSAYMEYTQEQETNRILNLWVALSIMSAAVERKVYINNGLSKLFLNLYVILVGPSGIKKSTAMNCGVNLLRKLQSVRILAQSVTDAALVEALRRSGDTFKQNGVDVRQSALFCYASELSTLLKDPFGILIEYITDLFDCQPSDSNDPWLRETKSDGQIKIFGPCFSLLGGTTPSMLKTIIPVGQMEAGFASRVLFVVDRVPSDKCYPFPIFNSKIDQMGKDLVHDLAIINNQVGEMQFSKSGLGFFEEWYRKNKRDTIERAGDERFSGYYARKDSHIKKLSGIFSLAESNDLIATEQHVALAADSLEKLEVGMLQELATSGKNEDLGVIVEIIKFIRLRGKVSAQQVKMRFVKDMGLPQLDELLQHLQALGQIQIHVHGPNVFYSPVSGAPDISDWKLEESKQQL